MVPTDQEALLACFQRIPAEDRLYLRDDVISPELIRRWAHTLDYRRVLPLLALHNDRIIGDGTLHHSRIPVRQHVAEVRIVIDPDYRNQGLGRTLLRHLMIVAAAEDRALEKLTFEVVADTEQAAQRTAQALGFVQVAVLAKHVRYYSGSPHDLLVLEYQVGEVPPDAVGDEPADYMF
jgi:L-amino acid N-acyltransferase YncA